MDYDKDRVDEAVLALLWLTTSRDKHGARAWKGHDWDVLDRLHKKGFIGNPKSKALSIVVTEEGLAKSQELFRQLFGKSELPDGPPKQSRKKKVASQ